jgi:hypothetical protein
MSEQGDLARDLHLADVLGRMPAPAIPAGLAERIARNATRLPQLEKPAELCEARPEACLASSAGRPARSRRWLPYAAGAAVAAALAIALLQAPGQPDRRHRAPLVAHAGPVAPAELAAAPLPLAATEEPRPRAKPAPRSKSAPQAHVPQADEPQLARDDLANISSAPSPIAAPQAVAVTAPDVTPTGQGLMGPPDLDDLGAPMAPRGGGRELGISGAAEPDIAGSSPAPRGQAGGPRSAGAPRF